jgi:Tfp pilus assembly protein PilF
MLMATCFYFAGLILFLKAATAGRRRWPYAAGLFLVSLLGMASRENFATFPLMLFLYDMFFISGFRLKETAARYKIYLPVILSFGYFAFLALNNTYAARAAHPGVGLTPAEYVLTALNAHLTYIRLLVFPIGQNADHDYRVATALFEYPTLVSFLCYLGLWAFGISLARKRPAVSFSTLWFLITLLPVSFAVALMGLRLDDVIFEHRLYLPGAAIMVALSSGAVWAAGKLRGAPRALSFALVVVLALTLSYATYSRTKSPGKSRAYNNLADAYVSEGNPDRAIELLKTALTAERYNAQVHLHHYGLALAYEQKGLVEEAIEQYRFAINFKPDYAEAHNNLALAYISKGLHDKAEEHLKIALSTKPDYAEAHNNLGALYVSRGRPEDALKHLEAALSLKPDYAQAYNNLGLAYAAMGRIDKAIGYYRAALKIEPDSVKIRDNLNRAYLLYEDRHGVPSD